MRLVVLDTNVIVSAGIRADWAPAKLNRDWVMRRQVQLVCSPFVAAEYREMMRREKFRQYDFPPMWLEFAIEESLRLPEPGPWHYPCPEPKDAPFLALAQASGAWLVTGNQKHFPETARGGARVISPGDYLAHLTGAGDEPA